MERLAKRYIINGLTPANQQNTVYFLKVCAMVAAIACVAFASGQMSANKHQAGDLKFQTINALQEQISQIKAEQHRIKIEQHEIKTEQLARTPRVYSIGLSQ